MISLVRYLLLVRRLPANTDVTERYNSELPERSWIRRRGNETMCAPVITQEFDCTHLRVPG